MFGHRYPALEYVRIHLTLRKESVLFLVIYQTTRHVGGEIFVGVSFRRLYRKGYTCSHPEHRSQAFRADDSAHQRESRYCRILKKTRTVRRSGFFFAHACITNESTASPLRSRPFRSDRCGGPAKTV